MSPLNFAIVGLKLLGIYFFIQAVLLLSSVALIASLSEKMNGMGAHSKSSMTFTALLPCMFLLLGGGVLFFCAVPLARRLCPPSSDKVENVAWSFNDLQAIIFAATGIIVLSYALPGVARAVVTLYGWYMMPPTNGTVASEVLRDEWMYSVGVIAQVIIGLMLILNPRGFRNLWGWLRTAGTETGAHPQS
jgi:hypothetical protein